MSSRLDAIDWPLRTERLFIRPASAADVEQTWEFRRLPEVNRWITRAPQSFGDYRAQFLEPERLEKTLVIVRKDTVIGDLYLAFEDAWAQAEVAEEAKGVQAEIGWSLHPEYGGQGYATEATRALINLCFTGLGLRRLVANCFADNTASWRMMERLGMRREAHTVRESLHRDDGWLDGFGYALLAEEWTAAS
jgi:RimJ/RimL family protein N-acetyltransferase